MKKQMVKINFGFEGSRTYGANIEDFEKEFNLFDFADYLTGKWEIIKNTSLLYQLGKLLPEVKKDAYGRPMASIGVKVFATETTLWIFFDVQPDKE